MIDLTPIMEAIIALVVAVITAFVIPWLKGKNRRRQAGANQIVGNGCR